MLYRCTFRLVFSVPEVARAAHDQFLCGMLSRINSYRVARMPMLLPVLLVLF